MFPADAADLRRWLFAVICVVCVIRVPLLRRKGNDWYIGGITNWTARDITIDLSFLPDGDYVGDWYVDGRNAHRDATDYRREKEPVGFVKTIHLAPGGGFAAKISKE